MSLIHDHKGAVTEYLGGCPGKGLNNYVQNKVWGLLQDSWGTLCGEELTIQDACMIGLQVVIVIAPDLPQCVPNKGFGLRIEVQHWQALRFSRDGPFKV